MNVIVLDWSDESCTKHAEKYVPEWRSNLAGVSDGFIHSDGMNLVYGLERGQPHSHFFTPFCVISSTTVRLYN